jgi:hypothetical protein
LQNIPALIHTPGVRSIVDLFRPREVTPPDVLHRVATLEAAMRTLETEQVTLHTQVRQWMRRAVAAERRLDAKPAARHTTSDGKLTMWGARARIAQAISQDDSAPESEETNGVHP